ncbi:tetratricopeptide repeat protein [Streptomyces lavendulocolor]|uniref:tetratricopeptide repeat protein n=1 Tax=Streptomyces lavendulocolor TaxID=67316 RepID=UPI003C2F0154
MPDDPRVQSLRTAVAAAPADVLLRLHLARLQLEAGRPEAAVAEAAVALQHAPGHARARDLMARAMGAPARQGPPRGRLCARRRPSGRCWTRRAPAPYG